MPRWTCEQNLVQIRGFADLEPRGPAYLLGFPLHNGLFLYKTGLFSCDRAPLLFFSLVLLGVVIGEERGSGVSSVVGPDRGTDMDRDTDASDYLESRYDTLAGVLRELYERLDVADTFEPGRFTRYDNARNRTIGFADHGAEERFTVSLPRVAQELKDTWPEAAEMLGMTRLQLLELLRTEESRSWLFSGEDPWEWLEKVPGSGTAPDEGEGVVTAEQAPQEDTVTITESVPDSGTDPEDFVWGVAEPGSSSESEVSPDAGGEVDELEELALGAIWGDLEAQTENDLGEVLGPREAYQVRG